MGGELGHRRSAPSAGPSYDAACRDLLGVSAGPGGVFSTARAISLTFGSVPEHARLHAVRRPHGMGRLLRSGHGRPMCGLPGRSLERLRQGSLVPKEEVYSGWARQVAHGVGERTLRSRRQLPDGHLSRAALGPSPTGQQPPPLLQISAPRSAVASTRSIALLTGTPSSDILERRT